MIESPLDSPFHPTSASPNSALPNSLSLSRRSALTLGALAGVAALTLPRFSANALNLGSPAQMKFLENAMHLQSQFFGRALMSTKLDGLTPTDTVVISAIEDQDGEQARWFALARARGGNLPPVNTQPSSLTAPTFTIDSNNYATRDRFFDSALTLKKATVGAFHGLVGAGGRPEIVQALAALAGVQNRHLAMLSELVGKDPFVTYVEAISLQEAGNALGKFGFGTEVGK